MQFHEMVGSHNGSNERIPCLSKWSPSKPQACRAFVPEAFQQVRRFYRVSRHEKSSPFPIVGGETTTPFEKICCSSNWIILAQVIWVKNRKYVRNHHSLSFMVFFGVFKLSFPSKWVKLSNEDTLPDVPRLATEICILFLFVSNIPDCLSIETSRWYSHRPQSLCRLKTSSIKGRTMQRKKCQNSKIPISIISSIQKAITTIMYP